MHYRRVISTSVLAFLFLLTVTALPALSAPEPVIPSVYPSPDAAGQATLFNIPGTNQVSVDWMVLPYVSGSVSNTATGSGAPPPGTINTVGPAYLYLYQLENTSAPTGLVTLTINIPAISSILGGGILVGDDLDIANSLHPAHNSATFPVLTGETEGVTVAWPNASSINNSGLSGTVSWTDAAAGLAEGDQSYSLFFVSNQSPMYGAADVIDGDIWSSGFTGSDFVPVPIPEPSTIFLGGISLAAMVMMRWWNNGLTVRR